MINKLAKAQKSWIAKFILILTALSFMSLFGVTGYINSAGSNRTVIKVDNIEISQAQFSYLLQREINTARHLLGDRFDLTDEMRQALIQAQTQQLVQDAVLDRTEAKYHVSFRPALIQSIIFNDPAFKDASGNFNRDVFRQVLSRGGTTEEELVADIERDLTRRLLINMPVEGINVPEVLRRAEELADNKRRTFRYVIIRPEEVAVDRKISEDEVEQYYEDFAPNFIEPERRDVTVLLLSMKDIADKMVVDDEEVKAYYEEHKNEYETPQTRQVLQMMFADEQEANKAYFALQSGTDFYKVAEEVANQSKEDTDLGYVAEDELVYELSAEAFSLPKGGYTKPVQVGDMWQILKVADIKAGEKVPYAKAAADIREILKNERLYDESYEILTNMEDALAAGSSLEALAKTYAAVLLNVQGVAENKSVVSVAPEAAFLLQNMDFIDTVFSYNAGEISQVLETEDGLAVVRVDKVIESHPKDIDSVRGEIEELWTVNEKAAIAQEMLNNLMYDLENGDALPAAAKRYGLKVYRSQPVTRNETFANIGYADIREMFTEPLNTPKQIQQGDDYVIAVAEEDYKNSAPLSENEQLLIKRKAYQSLLTDYAEAMLSSFADEYDISIQYKLLGFEY